MRGLTPMERELLHLRVNNGPRVSVPPDHPIWGASAELQRLGRIFSTLEQDDNPTGLAYVSHITALGRLALRVCPVDEF